MRGDPPVSGSWVEIFRLLTALSGWPHQPSNEIA
jgi:hypothetical protein